MTSPSCSSPVSEGMEGVTDMAQPTRPGRRGAQGGVQAQLGLSALPGLVAQEPCRLQSGHKLSCMKRPSPPLPSPRAPEPPSQGHLTTQGFTGQYEKGWPAAWQTFSGATPCNFPVSGEPNQEKEEVWGGRRAPPPGKCPETRCGQGCGGQQGAHPLMQAGSGQAWKIRALKGSRG